MMAGRRRTMCFRARKTNSFSTLSACLQVRLKVHPFHKAPGIPLVDLSQHTLQPANDFSQLKFLFTLFALLHFLYLFLLNRRRWILLLSRHVLF